MNLSFTQLMWHLCRSTEAQQLYVNVVQLIDALSHGTKYVHDDAHVWLGNYSKLVLCLLFLNVKMFEIISLKVTQRM